MTSFGFKKIIGLMLVLVLAVATGFSVGKIYVDSTKFEAQTSTKTEAELREDENVVNRLYARATAGESVSNFSGVELFLIAERKLSLQDYYLKEMTGSVNSSGTTCYMRSQKIKNDNDLVYYKFSPSKNIMGIATPNICSKISYTEGAKNVKIVKENQDTFINKSSSETLDARFQSPVENYTMDKYNEVFGTTPNSVLNYIVSSKTCKNNVSAVTKNDDETYTFTIEFSGESLVDAVLFYSKEIMFSSGYESPSWTAAKLTVTIDSNFNFRQIKYFEHYVVKTGLSIMPKATVKDDFVDIFYYDVDEINSKTVSDFTDTVGGVR